jgi:hypothetical protein
MAIILLDTFVILDHFNGRRGRTEFLGQLIEQGHILACSPVNITEVYAGLRAGEESAGTGRRGDRPFPTPTLPLRPLP